MRKLFYFVLASCMTCMVSCGTKNVISSNENTYGVSSVRAYVPETLSVALRDSMINADKLPAYDKWNKSYLRDGETNKAYEFATVLDNTTGIIYTVKLLNEQSVYVVQKRKTTK